MNSIVATVNNYQKGKKSSSSYVDKTKTASASSGKAKVVQCNNVMLYVHIQTAESIQEVYECNEEGEENSEGERQEAPAN